MQKLIIEDNGKHYDFELPEGVTEILCYKGENFVTLAIECNVRYNDAPSFRVTETKTSIIKK